ncbi:2',3'-cyclic-nucleotide 2'-phosphodiesterase / 3'-nucleotidase [Paenibacillus sp. UNC496MF]|uniref:bifunctional metallophosphatase/5'-nucleotidase n=1 Tax=Paenibacillus sp. UNC496MF TaxID=1502753 RepID=UPI0008F3B692|nr:5'-nucleotidase C-terminal domain-containing protein [Paenibacillus sp. UNC496MF]SFI30966.1 2',3'-cyclic-nucleotide 2'-phosphodiesterase / 3'-nucleotidase [Paenibacillus sp. UNC496MF]
METKTISIIGINDFHAEIFETDYTLGCAKLCALVEQEKRVNPHTMVVFGGDNFNGDPVSEELAGEPVIELMMRLGAKVSAVGNHEFEYGVEKLLDWSRQGEFTFAAANVVDRKTGEIAAGFQPYVMEEIAGIKIAFIGLSASEQLDRPGLSIHTRALAIVDGAREARKWVDYLNRGLDPKGRPDAILALTHYGLKYTADRSALTGEEAIELCTQVPELSGLFTAHWHQFIRSEVRQVPVVQGGSNSRGFAKLTIEFSPGKEVLRVTPDYLDASGFVSQIPPNEEMQCKLNEYKQRTRDKLGVVLGRLEDEVVHKSPLTAEVDMEGTPLTKLVTDVMRAATDSDIALLYSGRMGQGLPSGAVTVYQVRKLFYFNDELITLRLKGSDLIRNIENGISTLRVERASPLAVSGLRIVADYAKPHGARIESIVLENGQSIDPDRYYKIVIDEWLASDEMGYEFSSGIERRHTGVFLRDRLIQEISDRKVLKAESPTSIKVKNKQGDGHA